MNETTFKLQGVMYSARKLDALGQFALARRLAPVLAVLAMGERATVQVRFAQSFCALTAQMAESEAQAIVLDCLATLERQHENTYSPVVAGGTIMFADVADDLGLALQLVFRALEAQKLIDFFTVPPSGSKVKPKG